MNAWKRRVGLACVLAGMGATTAPAAPEGEGPWAVLMRNPDTAAGEPPYVLLDDYGRVRRYVEPSPGARLDERVGERVRVLHDTGRTLLASQLDFGDELRPLKPSGRRAPAEFRPPREARSLDRRRDRLVPAQFDDTPLGESVLDDPGPLDSPGSLDDVTPLDDDRPEPIVLEDLLAEDVDELPPPDGTETLPLLDRGEGYYRSAPASDCPHCNGPKPRATTADCSNCQTTKGCPNCGRTERRYNYGADLTCCPPSRRGFYGRAEYLLWWFNGFDTPPLVTRGTTDGAAVLGAPGTSVVFGGGDLLDGARNGLRFTVGGWLDERRDYAIEADVLFFETETEFFSAGDPTGASVIGRPFFNLSPLDTDGTTILPPAEDAELVSFPGVIAGDVDVRATSEFDSFGIRLRTGLCCCAHGGCGRCDGVCGGGGKARSITRVDFITGFRNASLEEGLFITENLTSLDSANPGTFVVNDRFETDNDFNGVDLGFITEWRTERWAVELVSKIALGVTEQQARINGSTTVSDSGASFTQAGGLLALPSNIGVYERDRFSVLPELSARLAYRVTPRVSLSVAYSLVYWANVLRPGDAIDLDVDPRGIPPATATTVRPEFAFNETSFWAHGLNFGVDYNY